MENRFTKKAQNSLALALESAQSLGHSYIGSEHILLGLMEEKDSVASRMLQKRGLNHKKIKAEIFDTRYEAERTSLSSKDLTPRARRIIENANKLSERNKQTFIGSEHLLYSLLGESDCYAVRVLESNGLYVHEMQNDILVLIQSTQKAPDTKKKTEKPSLLELYGKSLNKLAKDGRIDPTLCREKETERVLRILLRRSKNNPCLIGEPGVGKTAVIEGLAQRIVSGNVPEILRKKTIYSLDVPSLIAGAKYRGEFEERIKSIMNECTQNSDIILFIDEIHTIIGAGSAEGAVDAANILKPALARGEIQVIGATTITEYRKYIEKDPALERRFQPININEPSAEESRSILFGLRPRYEAHHNISITDEAIHGAVELSQRYITDRYLPDKAIDLVDEAASRVKLSSLVIQDAKSEYEAKRKEIQRKKELAIINSDLALAADLRKQELALEFSPTVSENAEHRTYVTYDDVASIVTDWTGIPVKELERNEEIKLLSLESELKKKIIGQDAAIDLISQAIRRGRIGLKHEDQPTGSFLFTGPSGVGKSELCLALAELLFGSRDALIRFDMSEYMEKHSVSRLIGAPPGYVGYGEGGLLTEKVRRRPYSIILFDEMEKSHPDVLNIMLQILEDGSLTDSQGRRVDFKNTLIVMTSNIGSGELSRPSHLGFYDSENVRSRQREREKSIKKALERFLKPEFINRIDEIVIFNSLLQEDIAKICDIHLSALAGRIAERGIELVIDQSVSELIAKRSQEENTGARTVRKEIRRLIENPLSSMMISGSLCAGDKIMVTAVDEKINFTK